MYGGICFLNEKDSFILSMDKKYPQINTSNASNIQNKFP
jgi:hypothetical protein